MCQGGGAFRRFRRCVDEALDTEVTLPDGPAHDVERACDHAQHIVEVVRYPAGQLADRLHLLRLTELAFGLLASDHLPQQLLVGRLELVTGGRELRKRAVGEIAEQRHADEADEQEGRAPGHLQQRAGGCRAGLPQ